MVDLRNAPSYYHPSHQQLADATTPAPETPAQRHQAAASDRFHNEIVNDYWGQRNGSTRPGTTPGSVAAESDLENVMRVFGRDNGRALSRIADLVHDDGGTPGEATSEDLAKAYSLQTNDPDRRAVKYLQDHLGEISHENDWGGGWFDWASYLGSSVDLFTDDSVGVGDLRDYASKYGINAGDSPAGRTPWTGRTPMQRPEQTSENQISVGDRSYTLDQEGTLNYTIRKGDSISRVATDLLTHTLDHPPTEQETADYVRLIVQANQYIKNPNLIYPNDTLRLPPPYSTTNQAE